VTLAEVGGAQSYVAQLLEAVSGRFDVTVAAWGPGPLRRAAADSGAAYVELRHVQRQLGWRDFLGLIELARLCRRVRPDIVHANSSKAGVLGRLAAHLARVPVRVFTVHGWAFKAHTGLAARLYLWAERLVRPLTTKVICVSTSEQELGIEMGTCDAGRSIVIPNAVALPEHRPGPVRAVPVIVSIGRMKPPKDFRTLVEALAGLEHDFEARLVGDGPERDEVAQAIVERGLADRVELMGTREDVAEILAGADVFVLSSRSEGMPMSALEAMAAGLPVVASAVGGVPEVVVDGETGFLVTPEDAPALRAAIERLLADPSLRRRLGEAGRRRAAATFALPRWQAAHLALYTELLAERGLPRPGEALGEATSG
jgi:glycosyltransferase involved in cell wall biosynthesis